MGLRKIMFKSMEEGGGNYSISNEGHIRSYIGKLKIIKPSCRSSYYGVVTIRMSVGKRKGFSVFNLMKKYWPDVVLETPVYNYKKKRKLLEFSLKEISQVCGFVIKYNKVTTTNDRLKEYINRAIKMLTESEKLGLPKKLVIW